MTRPRLAPLAYSPRIAALALPGSRWDAGTGGRAPFPCDGHAWCSLSFTVPSGVAARGRLPEWPKGAVCKTVGLAYPGSNPGPATHISAGQTRFSGPVSACRGSGLHDRRLSLPRFEPWTCHQGRQPLTCIYGHGLASWARPRRRLTVIVTGYAWPPPHIRPEVDLGAFARPLVSPPCFSRHRSMITGN